MKTLQYITQKIINQAESDCSGTYIFDIAKITSDYNLPVWNVDITRLVVLLGIELGYSVSGSFTEIEDVAFVYFDDDDDHMRMWCSSYPAHGLTSPAVQ